MYDDVDVKCPFFLSSGKRKVSCEGITDDCTISLNFITRSKKLLHCEIFCNEHFKNCEIYRMLEEKYED
jgi:hypothetical protein